MARPKKVGLQYFPFDVDFFSDRKIKRLRSRFGSKGICVYLYLLCEIYRAGYQIDYNEDLVLDISDELNLSENSTREIVDFLLSRSLFDAGLAKSDKVLSSRSIQRRYQEAKKGGGSVVGVEGRTWLLLPEETYTSVQVHPCDGFSPENPSFSGKNPGLSPKNPQSKVKKSKGKKSKLFTSTSTGTDTETSNTQSAAPPSLDDVVAYAKSLSEKGAEVAEKLYSYYQDTGWRTKGGKPITDWKKIVETWLKNERSAPKQQGKAPNENAEAYRSFIYNIDE